MSNQNSRDEALDYVRKTLDLTFWEDRDDLVKGWIDKVSYMGFNPLTTIAAFLSIAKQGTVLNDKEEDLAFLITLFHERGSNLKKLRKGMKVSDDGAKIIDDFIKKYELQSTGRGTRGDVLTLPRIALSFPLLSCQYAEKFRQNQVIHLNLPGCMKTQAFAALIPNKASAGITEEQLNKIIMAHTDCMVVLAEKIGFVGRITPKTQADRVKEAEGYIQLGRNSGVYLEDDKLEKLRQLGILDKGVLHVLVEAYKRA